MIAYGKGKTGLITRYKKSRYPHLIATGFYINYFGHNSAKLKPEPMKPAPKDRGTNSAQDMYNANLLDAAMKRDPSDNVTELDGKNASFSRNHAQKLSVSQRNVIVHFAM
jgi:hypothetical protein